MYHYNSDGTGSQSLITGFDVSPGDLDYDYFWFKFYIDMPAENFSDGEIVYQWAAF